MRNKLLPTDKEFLSRLEGNNISTYNLSFDNFFGGKLIVWGNNEWFINDIIVNTQNNTSSVSLSLADKYYVNSQLLTYLTDEIENAISPKDSQHLYTIKSMGINGNRSTISFKNNYIDAVLYNLKIQNSLQQQLSGINDEHIINSQIWLKTYDFPEYDSIIGYWPLKDNGQIQIKNTEYLYDTYNYTLLNKNVKFNTILSGNTQTLTIAGQLSAILSGIPSNIPGAVLNTNQNKNQLDVLNPGYLYFDTLTADGNVNAKLESNSIKEILYNKKKLTPNTTLAIWAYRQGTDDDNQPIISDYNYNTFQGLYISPDVVKLRKDNQPNTIDSWKTIQSSIGNVPQSERNNRWVLYFYQFQHSTAMKPDWVSDPYISEITKNKTILENPQQGKMRINVHMISATDNGQIVHELLTPTSTMLKSEAKISQLNVLSQVISEEDKTLEDPTIFSVPIIQPTTNLFIGGIKVENAVSAVPTAGYSLWNGALRNMILFNTFLTHDQMCNMYRKSIRNLYTWNLTDEYKNISRLKDKPYIGSVYTYNMNTITVKGCLLKQNIKQLDYTKMFNIEDQVGSFEVK